MNMYSERLQSVRSRISAACRKAHRDASEVRLLGVGKKHPAAAIRALHALGLDDFGENQLQEARSKQKEIGRSGIRWHFVGTVQSNKTREIAEHFDWVQSVDRSKILSRLTAQRPLSLPPLNICIQVNIDAEPQKSGAAPEQVGDLAAAAVSMKNISLRGLMCIPRLSDDATATGRSFAMMKSLFDEMRDDGYPLDTLSMGMSADLELAIAMGSTMVRIGTDLFGPRPQDPPRDPG